MNVEPTETTRGMYITPSLTDHDKLAGSGPQRRSDQLGQGV